MPLYQIAYQVVSPTLTNVQIQMSGDTVPGGYTLTPNSPVQHGDASDPAWVFNDDDLSNMVRGGLRQAYNALVVANPDTAPNFEGNYLNMANVSITMVHPTAIAVAPTSISQLHTAGPVTLTATLTSATSSNRGVIWSSSNPAVATVTPNEPSNTAVVTGVAAGTCVITAQLDDAEALPDGPSSFSVNVTLT